ncbi:nucleotidyltransferase family protein [Spirulina major]|uniref:nucleotidyltransferase family protein n=1 Tax=Spirulina major TaxID=270636 RepID=UPI000934E7BB|nr:nucleotidyltransferase family protein [Spirulina major]
MKTLQEVRDQIQAHRDYLREHFRITQIAVFGSYARGEQTETSNAPTLWMLSELRDYLSHLWGLAVDVVTQPSLKPQWRDRILAEAIPL